MKKYLVMMMTLILMLTSMALADNVPTPHFGTQTETEQAETVQETAAEKEAAEEAGAPAEAVTEAAETPAEEAKNGETAAAEAADAEYSVPEGKLCYQYMYQTSDDKGFIISDWYFTDTVQAVDAAEKSVKIPATKGNMMLDVKYILYFSKKGVAMSFEEPACTIVDGNGKVYPCSMWAEGEKNKLSYGNMSHAGAEVSDRKNAYLIPVDGLSITKNSDDGWSYVLLDCVAEVPESIVGSDLPLYIIVHQMGETDYYVRIQ